MQVLFQIVDEPPVPIRTYNPALSEEVEGLLERALAKEPEGRFESVAEFASQLKAALGVAPPPLPLQRTPRLHWAQGER